jgi:ribosomal protein S12 methylthiotransferase accessory factor
VEIVEEDDVVYLLSETKSYYLKGTLYCFLIPFLDGAHTEDEIVERWSLLYSEAQIRGAIASLQTKGFVEEAFLNRDLKKAAFWNSLGFESNEAEERLRCAEISIECIGEVDSSGIVKALESAGITITECGRLSLLLTDDYLQPEIASFNEESLSRGRTWLMAKPVGGILWLGPLFIPGKSGCWECLAYRLRDNRDLESLLCSQLRRDHPFPISKQMIPSVQDSYANIIVTQVLLAIAMEESASLVSKILTFDAGRLEMATHVLTKRPQCPRCGNIDVLKKGPVRLESRIKKFTQDGGHRICSPAETLENFKDIVSPITGVVGELKSAFHDPSGLIDIYTGIHKIKVSPNFNGIITAHQNNSTGKGRSYIQSKASAFAEAVERYSAIYRDVVPDKKMAVSKMTEPYIALNDCMLFSETQYRARVDWNSNHIVLDQVPPPLDPDREIDWTRVWSLSEGKFKYVPTAYCYLGYVPEDGGEAYHSVESNGLAAGNVLEEAILQAFMEVIERDAHSIWWYNKIGRPSVDLDSFGDPYIDALRDYYDKADRDIWVLDVTSDTGIPVFVAVSAKRRAEHQEILFGVGAHFDSFIAVSRALTEMNQGFYILDREHFEMKVLGERNDLIGDWLKNETLHNNDYLVPDPRLPQTTKETHPYIYNSDIRDDIELCRKIIDKLGLEFLVHDLSLPDVGMKAVKVIIPGMRQIRPRYAPGRLYDIPVAMGWLEEPRKESQLNSKGWLF